MTFAVGIDVSKAKLDVAIFRDNSKHKTKVFSNNSKGFVELLSWLKPFGSAFHFCLEATGVYSEELAEFLDDEGQLVSVVNPASIKHFGGTRLTRTKTDKADAKLILDYCQTIKPAPWTRPSKQKKALAKWVKAGANLVDIRRQLANFREGSRENEVNEFLLEIESFITQKEAEISQKTSEIVSGEPSLNQKCDLLVSIPGIGKKTACQLVALLPEIERFSASKQLEAFVGLNPFQKASGSSVHRKTQISKKGNKFLRRSLYMPALSSMQTNPALMAQRARLMEKNKAGKVCVTACMRRIIRWVYAVLKSEKPFNLELAMPKN